MSFALACVNSYRQCGVRFTGVNYYTMHQMHIYIVYSCLLYIMRGPGFNISTLETSQTEPRIIICSAGVAWYVIFVKD